MCARRPNVFIGSSSEGLEVAEAIQLNLDNTCDVKIWHQGVFGLMRGTLEDLVKQMDSFDFAILVLTPDDLVTSRGYDSQSPRDNVLFEFGLFVGSLGLERTFGICERGAKIKIPSDLAGVTLAKYTMHADGSYHSSLGAPCTKFKEVIKRLGPLERSQSEIGNPVLTIHEEKVVKICLDNLSAGTQEVPLSQVEEILTQSGYSVPEVLDLLESLEQKRVLTVVEAEGDIVEFPFIYIEKRALEFF
ncbi:MAG: nucleotide-binding protein [Verrucomicrobiae bacterium]|nr:nucleotide-binding protein [Verrucomicrobiae bacterium]